VSRRDEREFRCDYLCLVLGAHCVSRRDEREKRDWRDGKSEIRGQKAGWLIRKLENVSKSKIGYD
jgi:hypothetical protein